MDGIQHRVDKVVKDVTQLKLNQTIGADSWIIYRNESTFTKNADTSYYVDFVPLIQGDFVARAYLVVNGLFLVGDVFLYPDANINGRWILGTTDVTRQETIYIHSTKEGTVAITPVS